MQRWRDLSIRGKIVAGTAVLILFSLVLGVLSLSGIKTIVNDAEDVINGKKLETAFIQAEVDHLKWGAQLSTFLLNGSNSPLNIQFDGHLCRFGKWLYGDERKKEESRYPGIITPLQEIEKLHIQLHASAAAIEKTVMDSSANGDEKRGLAVATGLYNSTTLPFLKKIQQLLTEIKGKVHSKALSDTEMIKAADRTHTGILIIEGILFLIGIGIALALAKDISRPLIMGKEFAETLAKGDFRHTLAINQRDETGQLIYAMNTVAKKIGEMIRGIGEGIDTLAFSTTELSAVSEQVAAGAEQTSGKAETVAAAAEEMSANMNSVAAAVEEATTNVSLVSSATDEMTSAVDEIAVNTAKASNMTRTAVADVQSASEKVGELGRAADEIGKVTEAITEISDQTNLLALNATIEAARAGDAGKGFAVVANEIKELAKQTAEATSEIRSRIEGIQTSTEGTVAQITQISAVINEVNTIVATIATAVEEQTATSKEIADNLGQASQGLQEVTENVAQSSSVSSEIAQDIVEVNQAARDMAGTGVQVRENVEKLSNMAEQLQLISAAFKV